MGLVIDTGKRTSQPRKYGNLAVDTGDVTIHTGNIVLGDPLPDTRQNREEPEGTNVPIPDIKRKKPDDITDTAGSLEMKMGQKISLNQKASDISRLIIGLEWELNNTGNQDIALDVSIFMVDSANKTEEDNFIFYNNPASRCGAISLGSDHHIGIKECYDEVVQLDLNRAPSHIQTLAVTVTIDEADERGQNFGQVSNAYLKIIDANTRKELLFYNFAEHLSAETAIVVTEIYRYKDEWKINAIGRGFKGGLAALCDNYGIETE
ncbi:TerD family protein [Desulfonema magnum]|uniref:TerD domain-containing protein n=1 Tax=Desulfonema magnum TaxID=45655 RepID=A0A975BWI3_9BACT|nr:TerD family protein [Desulfonema magnum]QTA92948.1 TerD domain-containing protein [Desulfonema magnum]